MNDDDDDWIMKEIITIKRMNEIYKDISFNKVWMEKNECGLLND